MCSLFCHTGCRFPLVFFVCSSVYCHVTLIASLWHSGSHVDLKKEFICALRSCLFTGCAAWLIQKMRKLQQGYVSLSRLAATPNCSECTQPRHQEKGPGDQGWASWRGRYPLVDICGERDSTVCHHPEPMGKEAVLVRKSETLALQKTVKFGSERNYLQTSFSSLFAGVPAKLADTGTWACEAVW